MKRRFNFVVEGKWVTNGITLCQPVVLPYHDFYFRAVAMAAQKLAKEGDCPIRMSSKNVYEA